MIFSHSRLKDIYTACFAKAGIPRGESDILTRCYMNADLRGVHSQGICFLPTTCRSVLEGSMVSGTSLETVNEGACFALMDGNNGLGPVIATRGMNFAIEKALSQGLGCIVIRNANDLSMLANYTMQAIAHDCIGIAMTQGAAKVAPWGGREPFFSTNPISIAIPANKKYPIVLDMATSVVAAGKISQAADNRETIPEGWAMDASGQTTTDPNEAIKGALLSLGGYKGFGLAIMVDVLSGVLAGMSMTRDAKAKRPWNAGQFFLAIHVESFVPKDSFKDAIDEFIVDIKSCRTRPGFSEIKMPGERGYQTAEKSRDAGAEIPDFLWQDVIELTDELNVAIQSI